MPLSPTRDEDQDFLRRINAHLPPDVDWKVAKAAIGGVPKGRLFPLSRDELRALCDEKKTADAIKAAIEAR